MAANTVGTAPTLLGLGDTDLARRLIAGAAVRVDFLETGGPRAATAAGSGARLFVHNAVWNWSLAHPCALDEPGVLSATREILDRTAAPWLSVHLGFASTRVAADGPMMVPRSPVLPREAVQAAIARNARALAAALQVPLLFENLDYWPSGAYEYISEPGFITDVLEAAGTGFLLDLAHARVAAARLSLPIDEYLARLPLGRVRAVHVSGPRMRDGVLLDEHEPLSAEDDRLLRTVLDAAQPAAVTFEYHGTDPDAVRRELPRLRSLLEG